MSSRQVRILSATSVLLHYITEYVAVMFEISLFILCPLLPNVVLVLHSIYLFLTINSLANPEQSIYFAVNLLVDICKVDVSPLWRIHL